MRIYSTIIVCLFALISCSQEQSNETKFQDEKGRFKVSFPSEPVTASESGEAEYGKITIYSFKSEPKNDDNLSYEVYYIDYPESFVDTLSDESVYALFNGSQETNINSENIQLIGTFNHDIQGYIGREFRWQYLETKVLSRARFYMVKNRMYILAVNTNEEDNFNVGINEFFESFELLNTEPSNREQVAEESVESIYKVNFPKSSETREMEVPTEYGNAQVVMEAYQPKLENDDNFAYMGMLLEYPEDITKTDGFNLENYFSDVVQAALAGRQSTLISQKEISINGIKGIEVKESFRGGQIIIKSWTFLKGKFQIGLQVMTLPENDDNDSMNDFFDSFEFVEN